MADDVWRYKSVDKVKRNHLIDLIRYNKFRKLKMDKKRHGLQNSGIENSCIHGSFFFCFHGRFPASRGCLSSV